MTDARKRLDFVDVNTGKTAKWNDNTGYPVEMAVIYLGRRVGTLYERSKYGPPHITFRFQELWPGTHTKTHWIRHLRAHLLRHYDAKAARLWAELDNQLKV